MYTMTHLRNMHCLLKEQYVSLRNIGFGPPLNSGNDVEGRSGY